MEYVVIRNLKSGGDFIRLRVWWNGYLSRIEKYGEKEGVN